MITHSFQKPFEKMKTADFKRGMLDAKPGTQPHTHQP